MTTPTTPMEAGRELDALIAERVMGWARGESMFPGEMMLAPGSVDVYHLVPSFSTDIAAAFLVVEKLARLTPDPWMLTLTNWRYYDDWWYQAKFSSHVLGPDPVEAKGDSPAHAICLGALAALADRER